MSKYILCDIEATGNREKDKIIQLGLMIFENLDEHPLEIYGELNYTDVDIMTEAMEIHNITPEMLKDKKNLQDTVGYKKLCEVNTEKNIFVAHDAPSDIKMLYKESFKNKMMVIDTLKCARHLLGQLDTHRLQFLRYKLKLYRNEIEVAKRLNINLKAHDAISDILVMKLLLSRLVVEVKKKFELVTDEAINKKLIELSETPAFLKKFKFGKYKGEFIEDVSQNDHRYIEWMRDNLKLDEDMKYTLDHYL